MKSFPVQLVVISKIHQDASWEGESLCWWAYGLRDQDGFVMLEWKAICIYLPMMRVVARNTAVSWGLS